MKKAKAWVIEGKDEVAVRKLDIVRPGIMRYCLKQRYALCVPLIEEPIREPETTAIRFSGDMSAVEQS